MSPLQKHPVLALIVPQVASEIGGSACEAQSAAHIADLTWNIHWLVVWSYTWKISVQQSSPKGWNMKDVWSILEQPSLKEAESIHIKA